MKTAFSASIVLSTLFLAGAACAIPPTPPLEVATEFKPLEGAAGVLAVQVTVHQPARALQLEISTPTVITARAIEPAKGEMETERVGEERLRYSLRLADRVDRGELSATVELVAGQTEERETWPVEVRVIGEIEDGGTAVGHASLLATVEEGRLMVRTPEAFRRQRRVEAERAVQEMARKDPGFNIESVLAGEVKRLDERAVDGEIESRGDDRVLQGYPGGLSSWERQAYVDRSREVEADLDPITVRGRDFFVDLDGVTRPLVNATVRVMDDDWGPDEHITSTITGWDGRFSTVVNNSDGWFQDGRDIYIRILTTNSRFRVEDCSYWPDWTYAWRANDGSDLSDGSIVDFGSFSLAGGINGRRAAMMFQRMNSAWNHFTTAGAQDPGFVDGCYPDAPTHYDTFWGEIDISGSDFDSRDIIVHEWGHAIQDNAQIWNAWSGASHSFCGLTNREQAFVEGWATFVTLDVFPDNRFNWNPGDTGINLESYSCSGSRSTANGPRDEGRIAAALLDLRDGSNDCAGGCGTPCDANSANRVGLRTIWRDAMWGTIGIATDDAFEFWRELCPVVTATQRPLAVNIHDYNCLDVASCVVPSQMLKEPSSPSALEDEDIYPPLARLRTELKKTEAGRRLVDAFFRTAPALVEMAERSPAAKEALASLRKRLALAATWLTDESGRYRERVPVTEALLRDFQVVADQLREEYGDEVTADLSLIRQVLVSMEGRSVEEAQAKLATRGEK